MRASPAAKPRNAAGNRTRRGLWAVAFLTLALLAAILARETARSLRGAQQPRQVLASAPGTNGQDAHAADVAPAGRTTASVEQPQQQGHDGGDPLEQVMDADEQELLDSELDAADASNSSAATSSAPVGNAAAAQQTGGQATQAGTTEQQPADSSGEQQQGSGSVADTAAAPAARLPKVKPGQLDAVGGAVTNGTAAAAGSEETAADSTGADADDASFDLADLDVDEPLAATSADSQSVNSTSDASAGAAGGSTQQQPQGSAKPQNADWRQGKAQAQAADADGAVGDAASRPTDVEEDSTEPADEPDDEAEGSRQPDVEPARDSFPAAKMQALGREAQEAKWAAEDARRQQEAAAVASADKGQPAGGTRAAKQQAASGKQSAAEQAAAGGGGEGVSDRDGAADGSTQPRAPVKKAAAAGGGGKAPAGGKGGGKGLAADKAAAAAAAKEAAKFRRQLSELRGQVLDERQLDTGIVYYGDMARVRSFMHKLRNQQPVHLAVVGGSISVGLGEDGFGPGVFRRVAAAFPGATHRFHNGALGGVTSTYMNSCLKWHVPPDVDLVIVEFNCNDGIALEYCSELPCKLEYGGINHALRRGYERLLRKLLMLPHRPAVIMLQTFDFSERVYMNSGEDQLGLFAQMYGLPWLSFRGAVWKRQQRGVPGYSIPELMLPGGGDKHPNPYGHQMLADLVAGLLRRVGEGLAGRPFTPEDQALVDEDLLPPVLPGNIAWDDEYCYIDDKFRKKVTESPGFQWVDEAKPHHFTKKEGFVATKPGAFLLLTVNTAETTQTDVPDPHTVVTVNHLRSYEHMGQAEITCVSGCTCPPSLMDGHWEQKNSQLAMHRFSVSQAKQCTMKIEVLNSTSSGEHKVKIQGLVISDEASAAGELPGLMPQIIPTDLMGAARLETNN